MKVVSAADMTPFRNRCRLQGHIKTKCKNKNASACTELVLIVVWLALNEMQPVFEFYLFFGKLCST